jgi:dGTPase
MESREMSPRERAERDEPRFLSGFAAKSTDPVATHREYPLVRDEFRTEFDRDYTRIIHSRAFRRLRHKTQVFISPVNDHLCTRLEHSLHVASVARTISKALALNNELVSAIAVGHDLGHAPFGHWGENVLAKLGKIHDLRFEHEIHGLRVVDHLESAYTEHKGLNLTFAVRDGIACHCGEGFEKSLQPDRNKNPDSLIRVSRGDRPATLEGCVVRFADKVAYLGRDLEDAIEINIIKREDIPPVVTRVLGKSNREIIGSLIGDIFRNSLDQDCIITSEAVHMALNEFYRFNRERIYGSVQVTRRFRQVESAMAAVFDEILGLIATAQKQGAEDLLFPEREERCLKVLREFLTSDVREWHEESAARLTIDFIAGMTDTFFIDSFKELFLPGATV